MTRSVTVNIGKFQTDPLPACDIICALITILLEGDKNEGPSETMAEAKEAAECEAETSRDGQW